MNIKKYKRTILFIIMPVVLFTSLINGCICDNPDSGMFVALDYDTNEVTHSADGINWSSASKLPQITDVNWSDVCYGDGKFIAIARNKDIASYSEDGIKWFDTELPDSTIVSQFRWFSVCHGNGKFVAIGQVDGNNAAYSTDGKIWHRGEGLDNKDWVSVCYGNGIFIAVSYDTSDAGAAYSTDGKNWYPAAGLPNKMYSVCYGKGRFVAVSYDGQVAYSLDGGKWSSAAGLSGMELEGVCYGDGKFVTASYKGGGVAAYSTDGINWKEFKIPIENCFSITYGFDSDIFGFL